MRAPDRLRRLVERVLPWYDPAAEAARAARTETIRQESIAVRQGAERELARASAASIREAYVAYADKVRPR